MKIAEMVAVAVAYVPFYRWAMAPYKKQRATTTNADERQR